MLSVDDGYLALELFYGRRDLGVSTLIIYCLVYLPRVGYQVCNIHDPLASETGPGVRKDQDGNQWSDGLDQSYSVKPTLRWDVKAG
jgi:hypothetical protein